MNGIVRASIHIYNYKQASVHKTDEVERSCQDQIRLSLQTNPTWTLPVKKICTSVATFSSHVLFVASTCLARIGHVPFVVWFLSLRFVSRGLDHAWLLTLLYDPLRQFLVFEVSILKCEAFFFSLAPFFIVKIDVSSLKGQNPKSENE